MSLKQAIQNKILLNHAGPENAIKRCVLLDYCRLFDDTITDRKMRIIVKSTENPKILSCENGYFVPREEEKEGDAKRAITYLKKKAFPIFEDIQKIRAEYLGSSQMELF